MLQWFWGCSIPANPRLGSCKGFQGSRALICSGSYGVGFSCAATAGSWVFGQLCFSFSLIFEGLEDTKKAPAETAAHTKLCPRQLETECDFSLGCCSHQWPDQCCWTPSWVTWNCKDRRELRRNRSFKLIKIQKKMAEAPGKFMAEGVSGLFSGLITSFSNFLASQPPVFGTNHGTKMWSAQFGLLFGLEKTSTLLFCPC